MVEHDPDEDGDDALDGDEDGMDIDDSEEAEEDDEDESDDMDEDLGEDVVQLRDDEEEETEKLPVWSGPRHPTLDDGFFSIDRFNRETEMLEAKSKGRGKLDEDDEEELEEEIDLFAPLDDDEDENDEEGDEEEKGLTGGDSDDEGDSEEEEEPSGKLSGALKTEGVDGKPVHHRSILPPDDDHIQRSSTTISSGHHTASPANPLAPNDLRSHRNPQPPALNTGARRSEPRYVSLRTFGSRKSKLEGRERTSWMMTTAMTTTIGKMKMIT